MIWLGWLAWGAYCTGSVLTWCYVFSGLRPTRSLPVAWLIASGLAIIWPPFLIQHRRWLRKQQARSWVDQLEDELRALP